MADLELVEAHTDELDPAVLAEVRTLMDAAFDDPDAPDEAFDDDDWDHTVGGVHVLLLDPTSPVGDGHVVAHASVVDRILDVAGQPLRTGYVEGVATRSDRRSAGHGSAVMGSVAEIIARRHQLGALGTGAFRFYEQLGWERWQGPSFVRRGVELVRTAEDDSGIMVLRVDRSLVRRLDVPISCDDRVGDVW